jgi:hypothetical protein
MFYNPTKLHQELTAAGLSILGCAQTGRIDWPASPSPSETNIAQAVLAAHDPTPAPDPLEQYALAGISPESMLLALWDWAVKGNNEAAELEFQLNKLKGE